MTALFEVVAWTLVRIRDGGDRHLLGYRVDTLRGRTSSAIQAYDRETRTATTASGNRYALIGGPSADGRDDALFLHWLAAHDLVRHDVESIGIDDLPTVPSTLRPRTAR